MTEALKNILSETEQAKLAEKGISILNDDVLELVSGGTGDDNHQSVKKGQSVKEYQSVMRSSMMSYKNNFNVN